MESDVEDCICQYCSRNKFYFLDDSCFIISNQKWLPCFKSRCTLPRSVAESET